MEPFKVRMHRGPQPWGLMVAWISWLCLPLLAWGGFDEGFAAYQRGDYTTAYREWLPLAQGGHAEAQTRLGAMYHQGEGVAQNYDEALKWFRLAATQGHATAQVFLGTMYLQGEGVPQNYTEAVKWFRTAAEQGDSGAQGRLGDMYYYGRGVPRDYAQATIWFRMAAEQGHPFAQEDLGRMYASGRGVPQDFTQAHVWFNLAAARLPPGESQARAAKARETIAAWMTPAQLAEAQRRAHEWRPKHP